MKSFAQSVTGLGTQALLLASLLASGCGTHAVTGAIAARGAGLGARSVSGLQLHSRKPVRPLVHRESLAVMQNVARQVHARGVDLTAASLQRAEDDAATAAKAKPAPAAPKADEVDGLLDWLSSYGYDGDRKHMVDSIHSSVYQYVVEDLHQDSPYYAPKGWDPVEFANITEHYNYWLPNFSVPVESPDDYATQALMIAQSRQDVKYYVWVSKPADPIRTNNGTCQAPAAHKGVGAATCNVVNPNPFANVMAFAPIYSDATGFNIVKGVGRGGWMANIGIKSVPANMPSAGQKFGVIQDYFEMPPQFLDPIDMGTIVPIPPSLLY